MAGHAHNGCLTIFPSFCGGSLDSVLLKRVKAKDGSSKTKRRLEEFWHVEGHGYSGPQRSVRRGVRGSHAQAGRRERYRSTGEAILSERPATARGRLPVCKVDASQEIPERIYGVPKGQTARPRFWFGQSFFR